MLCATLPNIGLGSCIDRESSYIRLGEYNCDESKRLQFWSKCYTCRVNL